MPSMTFRTRAARRGRPGGCRRSRHGRRSIELAAQFVRVAGTRGARRSSLAQHRPGESRRPRHGGGGHARQARSLLRRRRRRRHHQDHERRRDVHADLRQAAGRLDRRDRDRAVEQNVICVGTGEGNPRNSASFGNGMYRVDRRGRALDAHRARGQRAHQAHRRAIPQNPDVAYVCALGHAWGPNEERGVFDDATAASRGRRCSTSIRTPAAPTSRWTRQLAHALRRACTRSARKPWRFDSGGGETALYKTTDGGDTWQKLSGRTRAAPSRWIASASRSRPSNPSVVYVISETKTQGDALPLGRRAARRGRRSATARIINFRPFYYADLRVDPTESRTACSRWPARCTCPKTAARTSATHRTDVHGDHQAHVDRSDATRRRVLERHRDGGWQVSLRRQPELGDRQHVSVHAVLPHQLRHAEAVHDVRRPAGQRHLVRAEPDDVARQASASATGYTVTGGDGFFTVPVHGQAVDRLLDAQGGPIYATNLRTNTSRAISSVSRTRRLGRRRDALAQVSLQLELADRAVAARPEGHLLRRQRAVPSDESRHVVGADQSPDLTTNDKKQAAVVGRRDRRRQHGRGVPLHDHGDLAVAARRDVIWVGTDDGNVQVTRDGGEDVDQRRRQHARAEAQRVDPADRRVAVRRGHGVRRGRSPSATTTTRRTRT